MQDLWQLHYQILLIISYKKFPKLNVKNCDRFLEYERLKENSIKYKCLSCNKSYSNKIDEVLKSGFKDTFKFSNNDMNKFYFVTKKRFLSL